jgi:L-lysine exporter family protein LysE/ArgO
MNIFFDGFLLQASLILALGAQNFFVLESGIKKQSPLLVASICSACDFVLIFFGVLGAGSLFVSFPIVKIIFGSLGVVFMLLYGFAKIRDSFYPVTEELAKKKLIGKKQIIFLSLSFSLLNPHVYLDTVVLIGGFSSKFDDMVDRAIFGIGAGSFSTLWFFGLAKCSSFFNGVLHDNRKMSAIYMISGLLLIFLAYSLSKDVFNWIKVL